MINVLICGLTLLVAIGCSEKKMSDLPNQKRDIYIQLYSVRDDIKNDFDAAVSKLAAMGFSGVEAAGYGEGKFYGLSPHVFKQKVAAMGMDILSSHAGLSLAENIQDTDWEKVWEWWEEAITAHKLRISDTLLFHGCRYRKHYPI